MLIDLAAMLGLNLLLPLGTITYPNAGTAIDLVWGNSEAASWMESYKVTDCHDHSSDHLPIETTLAVSIEAPQPTSPYNYTKTNRKELDSKLPPYLPSLASLNPDATSHQDVDNFASALINAISRAVEETTPRKKLCPDSKWWWNEELTALRREANRLRSIYRCTKADIDKTAWREKANYYTSKIRQVKRDKWREFVNSTNGKSIYQVKKYIASVPVASFTPTLDGHAASHNQKVELLQKNFFPYLPPARLIDISQAVYPQKAPFTAVIWPTT